MNILMLNGSPRMKGNTRRTMLDLKAILEEDGHAVELLDVTRLKIGGCMACDGCKKNGGHCVMPDDSDRIVMKVAAADAVVFGSPVYWWGISARLKALVDKFYSRTACFMEQRKLIGLLAVGANGTDNPQYRLIREQFACIAEYLHWELSFSLAFSACAADALGPQEIPLRNAARRWAQFAGGADKGL